MFCIIFFFFYFRWEKTINLLINYFLAPAHQLKHTLHKEHLLSTALHRKPPLCRVLQRVTVLAGISPKTLGNEGRREQEPGNSIFGSGTTKCSPLQCCAQLWLLRAGAVQGTSAGDRWTSRFKTKRKCLGNLKQPEANAG